MFKGLWKYFKSDPCWKNMMKVCVIYSCIGFLTFWLCFSVLIVGLGDDKETIAKSFIKYFIYISQAVFISYSLSIFVINSNEMQQKKYRFLWLFLFILAINPFGIISILMLMKRQKNENNIVVAIQETPQMIKPEKWFLLWAIYTSIATMIFIITIPIALINLINIKSKWKKELIDVKELRKIAYFSSDITLILASSFAF